MKVTILSGIGQFVDASANIDVYSRNIQGLHQQRNEQGSLQRGLFWFKDPPMNGNIPLSSWCDDAGVALTVTITAAINFVGKSWEEDHSFIASDSIREKSQWVSKTGCAMDDCERYQERNAERQQ
ncbi:MAG: hypothetical protein SGARI_006927, partial [Bacillariaceae sp.]